MKEWYSAKELAGITGLPNHPTNVTRLAKKQNWLSRAMNGVKGGGLEFSFNSLPPETQQQIKLKAALAALPQKEMVEKKPDADLMQRFRPIQD